MQVEACKIEVVNAKDNPCTSSVSVPARSHALHHECCKVIMIFLDGYLEGGFIQLVLGINNSIMLHQRVRYSRVTLGCSQVQCSVQVRQSERGTGPSLKELAHKEGHLFKGKVMMIIHTIPKWRCTMLNAIRGTPELYPVPIDLVFGVNAILNTYNRYSLILTLTENSVKSCLRNQIRA